MNSKKQPSRRGRPKTVDPEKLLEVALCAYWEGAPASVSVNGICKLAGVSKPSLYRHFGSEDGLMRATLERYAEKVLIDIFAILQGNKGLRATLEALSDFACEDQRMETGCLFIKMRSQRQLLGPETRDCIEQLSAGAQAAYVQFLGVCRDAGEWPPGPPIEVRAKYLSEQVALAITQRASGEDPTQVRALLDLALSALLP